MNTIELLKELTAISALSGREELMIAAMQSHFKALVDDVRIDRLGNVVATLDGSGDETDLLVFAHMDELGLIVRSIEDDGFIRFERVGGIPEKSLLGTYVIVHTDDGEEIPGLVGTASHHVTPPDEKYSVPSRLDMYIDIGCSSKQGVHELGIQIGDGITYGRNFTRLGEEKFAANSIDNRSGCAILIQTLANLVSDPPKGRVHFAATVQEEVNIRGAWPVFLDLKPDAAICLDVTIACDTPELSNLANVRIGGGPAVGLYEFHGRGTLGGLFPNPKLRRFIESISAELEIRLQREVLMGIITDAAFSPMLDPRGMPIASLAIPTRYTHSPIELCSLTDIEQTIMVLTEVARRFDHKVDLSRG